MSCSYNDYRDFLGKNILGKMNVGLIFLIPLFFLAGCSLAPKIQSDFEKSVNTIFLNEISVIHEMESSEKNTDAVKISFADALQRIIARDLEVRQFNMTYDRAQIDIQQAKSSVWPRVFLDFSSEKPINSDGDFEDATYSYGMFLRYDLVKALFFKDEVVMNEIRNRQILQQKMQIIKRIYTAFVIQLHEIEFCLQKNRLITDAFSISQKALDRAMALGLDESDGTEEVKKLEAFVRKYKRQLKENQLVLKRQKARLNHIMGFNYGSDIEIVDKEGHLQQSRNFKTPQPLTASLVKQIWNQRNDIEMAKNNLFLAQMEILQAKKTRLPRLSASLGLGDMYLDFKNEHATIVPGISVSFPLFDMGDSKRLIGKARKNRDLAKIRLLTKIREIINDLFDVKMKLSLSLEDINAVQEDMLRQEQIVNEKFSLYKARRADLLEYYKAQLVKNEQDIKYFKAVFEYKKIVAELKGIRGDDVPAELIKSL